MRNSASFPEFGSQRLGKLLCNLVSYRKKNLPEALPLFAVNSTCPSCGGRGRWLIVRRDGSNEDMLGREKKGQSENIYLLGSDTVLLESAQRDKLSLG